MSESGSPLAVGQIVPDYELLRRIGGGGYGEVWLARSKATGVLRAAKLVWRHKFNDDRPFEREFDGIRRFERISTEHPSQLAIFHVGRNEAEGYFYYVMELADNLAPGTDYKPHTLRADLESGRLPAEKVLQLGLGLAEALGHLHRHGLVHRDVKPSNVIFVNGQPKLADIGLVTDASDQCSIVGTEGYLPPEGPGTPQADIFALGKVLYEAVTGMDRREFPKLPDGLRTWPDAQQFFELNEIILKACAADPQLRYTNAEMMRAELAFLGAGKSIKRKRTRQWYWTVGKRAGLGVGAVAALTVAVTILVRGTKLDAYPDGPPSTNLEANAYCDKGMYTLRGDTYTAFAEAYTNFNHAIALDPNFARPYVGLLEMRVRERVPGLPQSTPEVMRAIAQRLEGLAPRLAATYVAESVVNYSECNFSEAERRVRQAIAANRNYELGQTWYGWLLLCYGRNEEAWRQIEICRQLAPSKAVTGYRSVGNRYYLDREYTNAITWYLQALQWQPHEFASCHMIQQCYEALEDYTNAIKYGEQVNILAGADETRAKKRSELLRSALAQGGKPGYWQQYWKWTEGRTNSEFRWKAVIQIRLGNTNAALDWLEKSWATHEHNGYQPALDELLFDDCWDGLHGDPRFQRLLDEVGLAKVMRPQR